MTTAAPTTTASPVAPVAWTAGEACAAVSSPRSRAPPAAEVVAEVLGAVRAYATSDRPPCPRCGSAEVVGWGGFAGRRRQRCRACGRTFSDLTGTPLAWSKKLHVWPDFLLRKATAEPLRASAAALGLHLSTAFRWRHIALGALRAEQSLVTLGGTVELHPISARIGRKGQRGRSEDGERAKPGDDGTDAYATESAAARRELQALQARERRRIRASVYTPRTHILVAFGRSGDVVPFVLSEAFPAGVELSRHLGPCIAGGTSTIVARAWRCWRRHLARVAGDLGLILEFAVAGDRTANQAGAHTHNAAAHGRSLLRWLPRFRGIDVDYLEHYMAWHILLHGPGPVQPRGAGRGLAAGSDVEVCEHGGERRRRASSDEPTGVPVIAAPFRRPARPEASPIDSRSAPGNDAPPRLPGDASPRCPDGSPPASPDNAPPQSPDGSPPVSPDREARAPLPAGPMAAGRDDRVDAWYRRLTARTDHAGPDPPKRRPGGPRVRESTPARPN